MGFIGGSFNVFLYQICVNSLKTIFSSYDLFLETFINIDSLLNSIEFKSNSIWDYILLSK